MSLPTTHELDRVRAHKYGTANLGVLSTSSPPPQKAELTTRSVCLLQFGNRGVISPVFAPKASSNDEYLHDSYNGFQLQH
jgi:hypothetical protein